jgi:hypothetical protein
VRFEWTGDAVRLSVKDDGAGLVPDHSGKGMGLMNMSARAAEFNGLLEVTGAPGQGTTVTITLPAEPSTARAGAHLRWAGFYAAFLVCSAGISLFRLWRGESIAGFHVVYEVVFLLLFAGHLGAWQRLRRRGAAVT